MEIKQRYDDICNNYGGAQCVVPITVTEKMQGTVQVYYQLENFYQNHRIYMKSLSSSQLAGEDLSVSDLSDCDPVTYITDIGIC